MATFREDKARARKALHARLAEPVFYFERRAAARKVYTARLHLHFQALGDLRNGGFAEQLENTPKVVFLSDDFHPVRDAYIVTKDLGAFRIDSVDPIDDVTRTAFVVLMDTPSCKTLGWNTDLPWCGEKAPTLAELTK